jgi:putative nucleotidyltransferase with HDIG domain
MTQTRPRVLVVDDDPSFARIVSDVLLDKGYDVVTANSAPEALELARDGQIWVAIVDLVLPDASGLELSAQIRALNPHAQVVILTGHGTLESALDGMRRGIFSYLQKASLHMPALEGLVHQAVERSQLGAENQRLLERLADNNRLMKALNEASARLAGETHLDRLLPMLVTAATELCGAAVGRVLLFHRSGPDTLVVETAVGPGADALRGGRLWAGEGLAAESATRNVPLRLESPQRDPRFSPRCDELGSDLQGWLAVPLRQRDVLGAMVVAGRPRGFEAQHESLLMSLARQAALAIDSSLQHERAINFFTHTSEILVQVLERLDVHYPGHSRRVAALADMVSRRLGLPEAERRSIHFGALLHDIGKVRMRPSALTDQESAETARDEMLKHPGFGLEILRPITVWEDVLPVVHAHHERWDGKGYPRELKGEEIPLGARIVAVADAFDAMTRSTPHKRERSPTEALAELEAFAGSQFDPRVVRLFVAEFREHGYLLEG